MGGRKKKRVESAFVLRYASHGGCGAHCTLRNTRYAACCRCRGCRPPRPTCASCGWTRWAPQPTSEVGGRGHRSCGGVGDAAMTRDAGTARGTAWHVSCGAGATPPPRCCPTALHVRRQVWSWALRPQPLGPASLDCVCARCGQAQRLPLRPCSPLRGPSNVCSFLQSAIDIPRPVYTH